MSTRLSAKQLVEMQPEKALSAISSGRVDLDRAGVALLEKKVMQPNPWMREHVAAAAIRVTAAKRLNVVSEPLALWAIDELAKSPSRLPILARIASAQGVPVVSAAAEKAVKNALDRATKELDLAVRKGSPSTKKLAASVGTLFSRDDKGAYDRLGKYVDRGSLDTASSIAVAEMILHEVAHGSRAPSRQKPSPIDKRWIQAAVALASHESPRLRAVSSELIKKAGPAGKAIAAGSRTKASAAPQAGPRTSYLKRYRAGEHEAVWTELGELGDKVREPGVLPQALDVARETMRRVRRNAEKVITRLKKRHYKLRNPRGAVGKPSADITKRIAALNEALGQPIPLSLQAFYELVGSIDLREAYGAYAQGEASFAELGALDPLVVAPLQDAALEATQPPRGRSKSRSKRADATPAVYIGPDSNLKYDPDEQAWDEAPFVMKLGAASGMDAEVTSAGHLTCPFVDLLRSYFQRGGFGSLQKQKKRRHVQQEAEFVKLGAGEFVLQKKPRREEAPPADPLEVLTEGLEAF
jgi:hypothetical protein